MAPRVSGGCQPAALPLVTHICSNEWMLTPDDFGLSDRHYRIQGHQLSEAMPDRCPAGHILGKNSILLSNHPCTSCTGSSHRTWRCRACDACWIWPACTDRPEWPEWPGICMPPAMGGDQPSNGGDRRGSFQSSTRGSPSPGQVISGWSTVPPLMGTPEPRLPRPKASDKRTGRAGPGSEGSAPASMAVGFPDRIQRESHVSPSASAGPRTAVRISSRAPPVKKVTNDWAN